MACALGGAAPPADAADESEKIFDLTIVKGALPAAQRTMRVQKNDVVRWRISSDAPGELHLHAYRVEAKLAAGTPAELRFKAFATGRFRIEWHAVNQSAGGQTNAHHHALPLATLEVHPK